MPLYTVTMKNGNTFQVRAVNKEEARRMAISRASHDTGSYIDQARGAQGHSTSVATIPSSVRENK